MAKPTGYELSRQWFDFSFENPELIKPIHTAIYFFACEHCNRLGGKEKFGLPSIMTMEAIGVKSHNTYIKALNDLIEWGFIILHQKSKNQYSANIIAISKYDKALYKALDKAFIKHDTKQSESTIQSTVDIVKPITINNKPINNKQITNNNTSAKADGIDFDLLLNFINKTLNKNFRTINKTLQAKFKARLKDGYTKEDIQKAILGASKASFHKESNYKHLRPEFFSRADKIDMYSNSNTQVHQTLAEQTAHIKNNVGKNSI